MRVRWSRGRVVGLIVAVGACVAPGEPITAGVGLGGSAGTTMLVSTSGPEATASVGTQDATLGAEADATSGVLTTNGESNEVDATTEVLTTDDSSVDAGASTGGEAIASEAIGWASVPAEGVGGVIGGAGGPTVTVSSLEALVVEAQGDEPKILLLEGAFEGYVQISGSNKTIQGTSGLTWEGGLAVAGSVDAPIHNLILRDLRITSPPCEEYCSDLDALSLRWATHVWIDHCELRNGSDGNLDITRESDYVTVSWCRFSYDDPDQEVRQSSLVGGSDDHTDDVDDLRVTFHHNWWAENVEKNMPRIRFGQVHVFNNYYSTTGNADCIRMGLDANVVIENNVFEGAEQPFGEELDASAVFRATGNVASPVPEEAADMIVGAPFYPPYPYTLDPVTDLASTIRAEAGPR